MTFTGYRADAVKIAVCLDVYVVSSLYEGLGRGLTEALASGRPVAATAVNGVVDIVEPGSTGLLAPPADPDALAATSSGCWIIPMRRAEWVRPERRGRGPPSSPHSCVS